MSERYQVRGRIGRGGMSAVYRAFDTVMGRDVALKRLLPVEETNLNESAGESLAREAAALARFQHPNVVTVFALEEDDEGSYVVMELVEGEDLHSVMKSGALSWEDFRDVAGQCLEPLVAAADLNLLHRDIKPGNIMLTVTASGRFLVKLLDFGLAKFSQLPSVQTLDQRGSFLGSIDFIAPEQLELRPLDQRTDLYSLGCVFYYMLVQESPFTGGNPAETSMNHIRHRCRPIGERRTDLPPLVADWIMRLISRSPDDRPADAREALKQFQDALKGIPFVPPVDDDDLPFAIAAEPADPPPVSPPPSGPVAPPGSGPVGPRAGSPGTRSIQTVGGSIPAGRESTGSGTGTQSPRRSVATGPNRARASSPPRPGATSSTRPAKPVTREIRSSPSILGLPRGIFIGGVGAFVGLTILLLLWFGGDGSGSGNGAVSGTSAPVPFAPLAHPALVTTADGLPEVAPLPVVEGLFARFVSAKAVFGRDYRATPAPGGQVAAWVNLAAPEKERSLVRDGGDGKGEHLPVFEQLDPARVPGLRTALPGITTTNRSSLTMLKHPGVLPRGFTLVAVMRIEAGDDRLFRIQPPEADGRSVYLATGYDGKISAVYRAAKEGPDTRISIPWTSGDLGLLVYRWNPDRKEHQLQSDPAGPAAGATAKGPVEYSGAAFGTVAIGRRGFGDSFDTRSGNAYFEFVVYDRILDDGELSKVTKDLANRYFADPG